MWYVDPALRDSDVFDLRLVHADLVILVHSHGWEPLIL